METKKENTDEMVKESMEKSKENVPTLEQQRTSTVGIATGTGWYARRRRDREAYERTQSLNEGSSPDSYV
jgi:hypothetical protein